MSSPMLAHGRWHLADASVPAHTTTSSRPHHSLRTVLVVLRTAIVTCTLGAVLVGCAPFGGSGASTQTRSVHPTPTSAVQGQLAQAVDINVWQLGVKQLETAYDPQHKSATVTIVLGGNAVPTTNTQTSAATELTKALCLMALQALWTAGVPLSQTVVIVEGPTLDEYANRVAQVYGSVNIDSSEAQRIDWANVAPDAAWNMYHQDFLRTSFGVVD